MATLADTIKGTSGLLAYWPLTDNQDQSGNGRHLATVGSPAFNQISLNKDGRTSVVTPASGGTLRIEQATLPKIKAVEGWFRLAGAKTGGVYTGVFGLNQPGSGTNNRYHLIYQDALGVRVYTTSAGGSDSSYPSATHTYDELSAGGHHFVAQLNEAGTQTEIYIDGVKDTSMTVNTDSFMQTAGLYLTVGAFYVGGAPYGGNCQCSDYAIYDRPLTQQEITDRAAYGLNSINDQALRNLILASNPIGYYPLDTIGNLGNDVSSYAHHGSQSGSFAQTMADLFGMNIKMTKGVSSPLVTIPDRAEYRGRTMTVECLITVTSDTNQIQIERGGDNKNWSFQTLGAAAGVTPLSAQFMVGDQSIGSFDAGRGGPLPTNVIHLIVTSANGYTKIYINGSVLIESTTATGNGTQLNQGNLPIHMFSRGGTQFISTAYLAHVAFYNRELTAEERTARYNLLYGSMQWVNQPNTAIPANPETRAQFQPQDVAWRGGEGKGFAGPMSAPPVSAKLLCQPGLDLFWTRDGVLAPAQGYIESTVTIDGEGVRRRVLCYTQEGALVGETWSRASDGKYRFDLLWLNRRYMLVAQDDPTFGPADYNAVAADYQQPTPYAPGQGVGLV